MAVVLLVDDEHGMRLSLGEFLRGAGHQVDAAGDADEAMAFLEEKSYDVLLTDIIMPKTSGIELMHTVRERYPDTKVILLTGGPSVDTAAEAVRAGAFDYVIKPVSREEIRDTVARAVHLKHLEEENRRLDIENKRHQEHLEQLVEEKTSELREREELFRIITTSAHDAILMTDSRGHITFWNDTAEKLFGYTSQEALGQLYYKLVVEEYYHETIRLELEKFAATGTSMAHGKTFEAAGISKDGNSLPVEISISSIKVKEEWHSVAIIRDITQRKQTERHKQDIMDSLRESLHGVIRAMSLTVESRDPYTAGHQRRVSTIARNIARHMGLSDDQIEGISISGTIHDIGKLSVPAEILSKPSRLNSMEFDIIKQHAMVGHNILDAITLPWPVAQTILQHHERMDGSGYPNGLKGQEISIEARILMVADVVEAISSHRPYREAKGMDVAIAEIIKNRGILYDPEVVDSCLALQEQELLTEGDSEEVGTNAIDH